MVVAVTQTAPDVEIGWSRRRHASRRRSGGVRHTNTCRLLLKMCIKQLNKQKSSDCHPRGWRTGRVDAFRPKGHGFGSRSSRHVATLGKSVTHIILPVALRRGIPAQYPCCVGGASE